MSSEPEKKKKNEGIMYTRGRKMQFRFWQKHEYFFGQLKSNTICKFTNYTLNHSTKLGLKRAGGDWDLVLILQRPTELGK